jgi:hypothetical protein
MGKLNQPQPVKPVHAQLEDDGSAAGDQSVKAHLHDGTGLPGQLLKELNGKQRRHSLLFSTIAAPFKANL